MFDMFSTVGVESSHGHDVAANVDGGAPLPGHRCLGPCKSGIYYSPLTESKFYM